MPNLQNQALITVPNVFETALLQFMLLFSDNIPQHKIEKSVEISRASRIFRIIVSWSLLLVSKLIGISSPLYFQGLVENANDADYASKSLGTVHLVIQTSAIGLMIGYCGSKLLSAVVQLISEFVLFPATTSVAEILPNQAFSAALRNAYKRNGISIQKKIAGNEAKSHSISASEKATAAYARRVLDRGLKAANQFLYRSIFNLLPAYVESICIVVLISYKTTQLLGVTAAVVAFSFVYITSAFMHYRVNIIRKQLAAEGIVNGFAEDSLALAETVASFGTMEIEEKRYADGLKNASKVEVEVRQSFSTLKLMQVVILGLGTTILMYCAWLPVSYKDPDLLSAGDSSDTSSIARNLMLSQSLFAQLCSVLSMVGQHFRDCVSGAEDMRELEEIVRTDALQRQSTESPPNQVPVEDRTKKSGGSAPILEVRNLHFGYPPNVYLQERSAKERKLSDASISPKKVILKNISFSIPSGGYSIGIVGPSGSGKSTLLRVLLSMESITSNNNSGQILINGVDVSNGDRVPFFSMVGQENDLFRSLNLLENVKYGSDLLMSRCAKKKPESRKLSLSPGIQQLREKEALMNAAMDSQLQPVVDKLKDGWASAVGPRGRLLSGGERQRVCLARALYRQEISITANSLPGNEERRSNGCILLMDEVTSSLDAKTESIVIEAIMSRVRKGATAVLIAHRLSSVQQCDMILVMRDGEIIERGTHAELLQQGAHDPSPEKVGSLHKNMSISNIEQQVGWYSEAWSLQSSSSPYPQTVSPTLKKKNVSSAIEADQLYSEKN